MSKEEWRRRANGPSRRIRACITKPSEPPSDPHHASRNTALAIRRWGGHLRRMVACSCICSAIWRRVAHAALAQSAAAVTTRTPNSRIRGIRT
jgi:hypothetical protein